MARDLADLRVVADYQFGAGAGAALFPPDEQLAVSRSSGGRPRQVHADGERLVSYGTDGRFTLGVAGGERLRRALAPPAYRVTVGSESDPYVREGRNAFAKFVTGVDPAVRPGDEVLVVDGEDTLLAVGRAALSAEGICDFERGEAVSVREGVPAE
ncbi:MAG: PUA domain-containing protein [Haloferacaceae archaeon]